jgi:hypothetical protein
VLQNAIGASANIAATSAPPVHEAQIAVIISLGGMPLSGLCSHLRGAKPEEFRHVPVERYREFVPDRGGVPDVV